MSETLLCPQCQSQNAYFDSILWTCPDCFFEWNPENEVAVKQIPHETTRSHVDAYGTSLEQGDTVSVIQNLRMGSQTIKSGTKVKNIRLLDEPVHGHDISCKIDGFGSVYLKGSVVKKI